MAGDEWPGEDCGGDGDVAAALEDASSSFRSAGKAAGDAKGDPVRLGNGVWNAELRSTLEEESRWARFCC